MEQRLHAMRPASQQGLVLAKRIIALETRTRGHSETGPQAAFRACEKLRPHLATLMGTTGFGALLSRALALANAQGPQLRALQVNADGTLEGLEKLEAPLTRDHIAEGGVLVLAELLGLLEAFIGEALTLQIVREVWPQLSLKTLAAARRNSP